MIIVFFIIYLSLNIIALLKSWINYVEMNR